MESGYNITKKNNSMINRREIDDRHIVQSNHKNDLKRLMMERDDLFNRDTRNNNPTPRIMNGERFGEFSDDEDHEFERGMPMRASYTIKKPIYEENSHIDFDLLKDDKKIKRRHIGFYDPAQIENVGFSDIMSSMEKISTQVNPINICSKGIEKLNSNFFNYFVELFDKKGFLIDGYGLYYLFSSLYLSSAGTTEIELKNYFGFPKKDTIFKGLMEMSNHVNLDNSINIKNLMIVSNNVSFNPKFYEDIKNFCLLVVINSNHINDESMKINYLVNKLMNQKMRISIMPENLDNLQMMFLSVGVIHPIWISPFDKVTKGVFYGRENFSMDERPVKYLHSVGKTYGYYEDTERQILEIRCFDNKIVMGFVLNKDENENYVLDDQKLHFYISNIKESVMNEVKIPVFSQDHKIRYTNIFKETNLKSVFIKILAPDLFPENTVLHDVVQNIRIIVDNTLVASNKETNRGYRTVRKFIAERSFMYYIRTSHARTILFSGVYV